MDGLPAEVLYKGGGCLRDVVRWETRPAVGDGVMVGRVGGPKAWWSVRLGEGVKLFSVGD